MPNETSRSRFWYLNGAALIFEDTRMEVVKKMLLNVQVLWNIVLCRLVKSY